MSTVTPRIPGQKAQDAITITHGNEPLKPFSQPNDVTVRSFAPSLKEAQEFAEQEVVARKLRREAPREVTMPSTPADALSVTIGDVTLTRSSAEGYERRFSGGSEYIVEQNGETLRGIAALNALCEALLNAAEEDK